MQAIFILTIFTIFHIVNALNSALLGNFHPNRNFVYALLAILISFQGLFSFLYHLKPFHKAFFFKGILYFIAIYILIVNIINSTPLWITIVHVVTLFFWIVSYSFTWKCCVKNIDSYNIFNKFMLYNFFIMALMSFVANNAIKISNDSNIAVVALSYYCLACLPAIISMVSIKKKWLFMLIACMICFISMKRGAIITAIFMILSYYMVAAIVKSQNFNINNILKLIVIGIFIIILLFIINEVFSGMLLGRFSKDELSSGSGRSDIIISAVENISERNIFLMLLGLGSGSSTREIGITTHNDYLEFLFCFGILGFLIYMYFWKNILHKFKLLIKNRAPNSPIYAMLVTFMLGLSLFEGFIFNFVFSFIVIQLALQDFKSASFLMSKK